MSERDSWPRHWRPSDEKAGMDENGEHRTKEGRGGTVADLVQELALGVGRKYDAATD